MEIINSKKGKYKRSTNNCHKKYIGIVKNLVCLKLHGDVKDRMLERFFGYRNSRVYYYADWCKFIQRGVRMDHCNQRSFAGDCH